MARAKANLAGRIEAGYFQKTDSKELRNTAIDEAILPTISRAKRTYHLPTEAIILLERIQLEEFERTRKKPDLSDLVANAVKLLAEHRQITS